MVIGRRLREHGFLDECGLIAVPFLCGDGRALSGICRGEFHLKTMRRAF
jgi:hypothetical protein